MKIFDLLEKFMVAHNKLPPVNKDGGHLCFRQAARLRHGLVEHLSVQKWVTSELHAPEKWESPKRNDWFAPPKPVPDPPRRFPLSE